MRAGDDRQRPRKAPAVAVEHRQRPQIDRVPLHAAGDDVTHREQIGAAMMVDDALRIAGRPRRVVERDSVPLVIRHPPGEIGVAGVQEVLVFQIAEAFAGAGKFRVVIVDDQRLCLGASERVFHHLGKFAVDDEHPGLGMVEREGEDAGVEPRVEGVEHGAGHRHAVVRLDHGRRVGEHDRNRVAALDAAPRQRRCELFRARIELPVGRGAPAVDDRGHVRVDRCRARQEGQWREWLVVRRVAVEAGIVGRRHGRSSLEPEPIECKRL